MKHNPRSLLIALGLDALLAIILFAALNRFPIPQFFPCTHPQAQSAVLALCAALALQLTLGAKILAGYSKPALLGATILILLALWLGSYPYSPLGFSSGRIPLLRGFMVTTRSKPRFALGPGDFFTLTSGSPATIEPVLLVEGAKCSWASLNGGSLDNPEACDIAYDPPQAEFDILKIRIQPSCGLPQSVAQVKISILP
ncbi:MAG: hypothetical protein EHM81_08595 [Chloroflexi bacterium]|nr:MAG: hypothetical protein EHM81_08595 [Chloroflexota bacterium]